MAALGYLIVCDGHLLLQQRLRRRRRQATVTATGDGKAKMNQAVQGANAKEEGIEEEDEDHGARPRIRHLGEGRGWERGFSNKLY